MPCPFPRTSERDERKRRIRKWTGEDIFRTSIGLESADDLIWELNQVLQARAFKGLVGPLTYQVMKKL